MAEQNEVDVESMLVSILECLENVASNILSDLRDLEVAAAEASAAIVAGLRTINAKNTNSLEQVQLGTWTLRQIAVHRTELNTAYTNNRLAAIQAKRTLVHYRKTGRLALPLETA